MSLVKWLPESLGVQIYYLLLKLGSIPSTLLALTHKNRVITVVLAAVLFIASAAEAIIGVRQYQQRRQYRSYYASLQNHLFNLIDKRPVSLRSADNFMRLNAEYKQLMAGPLARRLIDRDKYTDNLFSTFQSLCASDTLASKGTSVSRFYAQLDSVVSGTTVLGSGPHTKSVSHAVALTWMAKAHLALAQEGHLISHTREAHHLLLRAQSELQELGANPSRQSMVENNLGRVFAHYLQNIEALSAGFTWDDIESAPARGKHGEMRLTDPVMLFNRAAMHYERADSLSAPSDRRYSRIRYENNLVDLHLRLWRRIVASTPPHYELRIQKMAAIAPKLIHSIDELTKTPLKWLQDEDDRLRRGMYGSDVLEVMVTRAQMKCLYAELKRDTKSPPAMCDPDIRDAYELLQAAIWMNFRDKAFFANPGYMGICPIIQDPIEGPRYITLVKTEIGDEAADACKECNERP
jgi:hypothetical protein